MTSVILHGLDSMKRLGNQECLSLGPKKIAEFAPDCLLLTHLISRLHAKPQSSVPAPPDSTKQPSRTSIRKLHDYSAHAGIFMERIGQVGELNPSADSNPAPSHLGWRDPLQAGLIQDTRFSTRLAHRSSLTQWLYKGEL